jgi:hypothetical protein
LTDHDDGGVHPSSSPPRHRTLTSHPEFGSGDRPANSSQRGYTKKWLGLSNECPMQRSWRMIAAEGELTSGKPERSTI